MELPDDNNISITFWSKNLGNQQFKQFKFDFVSNIKNPVFLNILLSPPSHQNPL